MKFPSFRRRHKAARSWKRRTGVLGGSRLRGVEPLEQRQLLSVAPTLAPIDDVILQHGTPKYIVLDGFDGDGDALAFTVESTNSGLSTDIPYGNRSLRMTVRDHGNMELQLFEGRAPITTEHIIGLVEDGFYNTTVDQEMTFHRIIKDFMIQGGDPEGDAGGSGQTIPDEFHEDLRHTMAGILSMANAGPGTGDSQFFITAASTWWLDNAHTIFGFLTEGDNVRESIENVDADANGKPAEPVVIESIEVFTDTENGVLILRVPEGAAPGTVQVTVTADDGKGGTASRTFTVTTNSIPELTKPQNLKLNPDDTRTITLSATDLDDDELDYSVEVGGDSILNWTLDDNLLTLTVKESVAGRANVRVTVDDGNGGSDQQTFYVGVGNMYPFLEPMEDLHTIVDTPLAVQISAVDLDGGGICYWGLDEPWNQDLTVVTGVVSGQMAITPRNGLIGVHNILVAVRSAVPPPPGPVPQPPVWDAQYVPLMIHPPALTAVELLVDSDTGISDSDRLTKLNNGLQFRVSGPLMVGAELRVLADGVVIANRTIEQVDADEEWAEVTSHRALGDGEHAITAVQSFGDYWVNLPNRSEMVDLVSDPTPELDIEIKARAPTFLSEPVEKAYENVDYFYDADTHDESTGLVTFSLTEAPAGMVIDAATGKIDWRPQAGDFGTAKSVTIRAVDDAGNETFQPYTINVDLGPTVDSWVYSQMPMVDGDFYGLIASRTGKLTVEALFSHSQGDIDIELWKQGEDGTPKGTLVGSSNTSNADSDNERIDVNVVEEDVYRVFVSGANDLVALAFTNLLVEGEGGAKGDDTLTVYGTAYVEGTGNDLEKSYGDDRFEITVGPPHEVIVHYEWSYKNDTYRHDVVYGPGQIGAGQIGAGVTTIAIDADQGNDTVAITGTAAAESVTMQVGEGSLLDDASGFSMSWTGVENVTVNGGGGKDMAELFDSEGDDTLVGAVRKGYASLSGSDYANTLTGFTTVRASAENDGNDTAKLYDSPGDDMFLALPRWSELSDGWYDPTTGLMDNTYLFRTESFDATHVYATQGGHDSAKLYDSNGNDTFSATPEQASLSGDGFLNWVTSFDVVRALASHEGTDNAILHDSAGNDVFEANEKEGLLRDEESSFRILATYFDTVKAVATAGGSDTATLVDSPGNDTFVGNGAGGYGKLSGNGFANTAMGFSTVSASAENDGNDKAKIYDSAGDDTFELYPDRWTLSSATHVIDGTSFDVTKVYSTVGGDDTALFYGSDGDDTFGASGKVCWFSGEGFAYEAKEFEKVEVFGDGVPAESGDGEEKAGNGGIDTAELLGTLDSDFLEVQPAGSLLELLSTHFHSGSGGYDYTVEDFEEVEVDGAGGNNGIAEVYDSSGNDTVEMHLGTHQVFLMSEAGQQVEVKSFKKVVASADYGGEDTVILYGSAGNDTFDGTPKTATLTNVDGNSKKALYFEVVEVYAGPEGSVESGDDKATLSDLFPHDSSEYNAKVFLQQNAVETSVNGPSNLVPVTSMEGFIPTFADAQQESHSVLPNEKFDIRLTGFDEVFAEATGGEGEDEKDVAELYDSAHDDLLEAAGDWAKLSYLDLDLDSFCKVSGFDPVTVYGSNGGTNQKQIAETLAFTIIYEDDTWVV